MESEALEAYLLKVIGRLFEAEEGVFYGAGEIYRLGWEAALDAVKDAITSYRARMANK